MRAFLLFLFLASTVFTQATDRVMPIAENIRDGYNKGDLAAFTKDFSDSLKAKWDNKAFKVYYMHLRMGWGQILSLGQPAAQEADVFTIQVIMEKAESTMTLALNKEGKVTRYELTENKGINFSKPGLASVFFRFPFEGIWKVQEGGDTAELNLHHASIAEAFAMDFIRQSDEGGAMISKQGSNAEDPSHGQIIHSPVSGTVTQVLDTVSENAPGQPNAFLPDGNFLTLNYARGEYAVFSHLKEKSCLVKLEADVVPGQPLALSGNSGDTPRPVVTFNVRTSSIGQKNSKSLKFGFACVETWDGKTWTPRTNYYPVKGDILRICPEPPKI